MNRSNDYELSIGRHSENDIVVDDTTVSRFHAKLIIKNKTCYIENISGRNGVFINGVRITSIRKLDELDVVRLGGYLLNWKNQLRNENDSLKQTKEYKVSMDNSVNAASIEGVNQLKDPIDNNPIRQRKTNGNHVLLIFVLIFIGLLSLILFL
jgi:pSer/pThr/pTyr-binding forkhead associated (FHA) protein